MLEKLILNILSNSIYYKNSNIMCSCGKNLIPNNSNSYSKYYIKCKCGKFMWFFKTPGTYPIYRIFKTIYTNNLLKIIKCTFFAYFDGNKLCKNTIIKKFKTINLTGNKKLTLNQSKSFFSKISTIEIKSLIKDLDNNCRKYNIKPNYGSLINNVKIITNSDFHYFIFLAINYYAFETFIKFGLNHLIDNPKILFNCLKNKFPNPNSKKISQITGISAKILNLIKNNLCAIEDIYNTYLFIDKFGNNKFIELFNSKIFSFKYLDKIIFILDNGHNLKKFIQYIETLKNLDICIKSHNPIYCIGDLCNYYSKKNFKIRYSVIYWLEVIENTINLSKKLDLKLSKYNKYILNEYNLLLQINNNYTDNSNESDSKLLQYYKKISPKLIQYDDNFSLICPKSIKDFKTEEYYMKNCISTYIENVIKNQSTILFLRNFKGQCYMTLELNNNRELVQAKKKLNMLPNQNDISYLKKLANLNNWTIKLR